MPSSYSSNLRLELIGSGEQPTTWGNTTNNNIGTLLEAAISGAIELTAWTGGDYTLSALKGAADQARYMTLIVPAALPSTGNIVAPAVPKYYAIINKSAYDIGIKAKDSAVVVTIPKLSNKVVVCDGTQFSEADTLPIATDTILGGVIVGDGLEAEVDGTLNVIPATGTTIGGVIVDPDGLSIAVDGTLSLDTATDAALGGVIVDPDGLSVDGSGTLSLDAATDISLGGVIVGSTLAVDTGVIDLPAVTTGDTVSYPSTITFDDYGRVISADPGSAPGTITDITIAPGFSSNVADVNTLGGVVTLTFNNVDSSSTDGCLTHEQYADLLAQDGTVTSVGISPATVGSVSNSTTTPTITLNKASASDDGYLDNVDFITFSNKFELTGGNAELTNGSFTTNNGSFTTDNGSFLTDLGSFSSQSGNLSLYGGAVYCTGNIASDTLVSGSSGTGASAVYATSGGTLTIVPIPSDARLKENIGPMVDVLQSVLSLNPVSFTWKGKEKDARGEQIEKGFIAQEVEKCIPEAVGKTITDEYDHEVYYIKPEKFTPFLVAAIQELNAKVEALTAEVAALKGA